MKQKVVYLENRVFLWIGVQFLTILLLLALVGSILVTDGNYRVPFLVIALAAAFQIYVGYQYLWRPYQRMKKICRLFTEGYVFADIFSLPCEVNRDMEAVFKKLGGLLERKKLLDSSKKQAEYLALQNQINPHFLYNTLEGIRSEALCAGVESVAEMAEALATFFRYTISNMDHLVTVEDELMNVENYFVIQRYRFGDKIDLRIFYEDEDMEEILPCQIPKLTLQPIVENAIRHGLEGKIAQGLITICFQLTEERLIITISDDGIGMTKEEVEKMNMKFRIADLEETVSKETKGGIAMANVNSRIKLIFGDEYGIYFYSMKNMGTDVEITLPIVRN